MFNLFAVSSRVRDMIVIVASAMGALMLGGLLAFVCVITKRNKGVTIVQGEETSHVWNNLSSPAEKCGLLHHGVPWCVSACRRYMGQNLPPVRFAIEIWI